MSDEFLLQFRDVLPPADIPIETMSAAQCLDVIADAEKWISHCDARTAQALARFAELRPPNRPGIDVADGAREEVSMELGIASMTAAAEIRQARDLVDRLPETLAALAKGAIDYRRAMSMAELTAVLSDEDAKRVEGQVLERGRRASLGKFRDAIRRGAAKVDESSVDRRAETARGQREVGYQPCFDGMGQLHADLTAEEAAKAEKHIDEIARKARTPCDKRLPGQLRADVLTDLIFGEHTPRFQVTVNATIPQSTLDLFAHYLNDPTETGTIADRVRELAAHPTWRRILTDPDGAALENNYRRRPSPALTRYVRIRDRTCRVPGCTAVADRSEIDHTVRHVDDGLTGPANTGAYCRFHNLWKERSSWTVTQPAPGTFTFTSPEGRVYTSTPEPYEEPP